MSPNLPIVALTRMSSGIAVSCFKVLVISSEMSVERDGLDNLCDLGGSGRLVDDILCSLVG